MLKTGGMGSESMHCLLPSSAGGFSTGTQREQARSLGSGSSEFKLQGSAPEERRPPWCPHSASLAVGTRFTLQSGWAPTNTSVGSTTADQRELA